MVVNLSIIFNILLMLIILFKYIWNINAILFSCKQVGLFTGSLDCSFYQRTIYAKQVSTLTSCLNI